MNHIKDFNEIGKHDAAIAGGKGASLGEMTQAGIPVPPGFVILADAFERFITETKLIAEIDAILETVDHREMHTVEHASETIQGLILHAEMPVDLRKQIEDSFVELDTEFVAVRSSATAEDGAEAAWAGQLDTFLNTTKGTLLENIQECWASLFTPRAIFYRFEKGMNTQKISVAVVVQKMVNSDAAGIAFSVHPVTEDYNQMIIEAGFGLGEAVVSGQVTPDSYIVTKEPLEIIEESISDQSRGLYRKDEGGSEWKDLPQEKGQSRVLSQEQIFALARVLIQIENHYGFPVDTEWAMENGELYIVQSRPITTLSNKIKTPTPAVYEKFFSRDFCLASVEAWVRGEVTNPKQWTELSQPALPYIVTERSNDTVHFWYDLKGVEWIQDLIVQKIQESPEFLQDIQDKVLERVNYLEPIYAAENELAENELKEFIEKVEEAYAWFEVLWWICQMDASKLKGIDISDIQKLRARTDKFCNGSDTVIRKSLLKIYPQLGELTAVLRTSEIQDGQLPSIEELQKRDEGYFFANNELFTENTKENIEKRFSIKLTEEIFDTKVTEIKGEIAQKGVVRGIVRKVMGHKQIPLLKEGEILVSPMTMPDFLPAMQRATAFVTDEGGITCHAAIIARELQKPCITGTKFATQILHDGDEVEVDAETGVVRILNRYSKRTFEKTYTRDTTLVLQGTWATDQSILTPRYLGLKNTPLPGLIHYVHNGTIEIWENLEATQVLMDSLLERNIADNSFFSKHLEQYKKDLEAIKQAWSKKSLSTKQELLEYVKLLRAIETGFTIYYRTAYDDRSPKELRDLALETRNEDVFFSTGDIFLHDSLEAVFPELKGYVNFILAGEIENPPSLETLKKRKDGFLIVDGENPFVGSLEEFANTHPEFMFKFEDIHGNETELTGQIAFRGIAQGKVKLLFRREEINDVQEGDILVSPMTTPDFLPAMKKAAAFITDEGGITCHASIVAREMKKPCVIGTKIATQVLKDGDIVEVDADKGIVRLITSNQTVNEELVPEQWQRLFRVQGLRFLFVDLWMDCYKNLDALVIVHNDEFTSYIPHSVVEQTLVKGEELISSENDFDNYEKDFRNYMKEARSHIKSLDFDALSKNDTKQLLDTIARLFHFYSKTEFFATDGAYKLFEKTKNVEIEARLDRMGKLKNDGRDFLNEIMFGEAAILPKLPSVLEKRFHTSERALQQYSREELLQLFDGEDVASSEIKQRDEAFYFLSKNSKVVIKTGKASMHDVHLFINEPIHANTTLLKGTTVNNGRVRGKARVFKMSYDLSHTLTQRMDDMQMGEILVAETTSPEFMPACSKAGAIITDQGGMLSHAAIVSRELNIPCIVGTGNATDLIKTGDSLEVDADNGIIYIL